MIDFTTDEIDRVKAVFAASVKADPHGAAGTESSGLDYDAFIHVVKRCADRGVVFTRFRDRYALRAAAQNPALGIRLFLSCFPPPAVVSPLALTVMSGVTSGSSGAGAAAATATSANTGGRLGFESFLVNFYFLTKASQQQRLAFQFARLAVHHPASMLDTASTTTTTTTTATTPPPPPSASIEDVPPTSVLIDPLIRLPRTVLNSFTHHYFRLQIDMLQPVIGQMVHNRSKQMEEQLSDVPAVDRSVMLLAAFGIVDEAITQCEQQILTVLTALGTNAPTTTATAATGAPTGTSTGTTTLASSNSTISVERWTDSLLSKSDLLNVLSVRGISTLIYWATDPTKHGDK